MSNVSRDFVSVDMRGMKAALVAHARTRRIGVSAIVRTAVARELGLQEAPGAAEATPVVAATDEVKVSIRLSSAEAVQLAAHARKVGLARGAYIGSVVSGVTLLARPKDHLAALTATCGELANLGRNLYHLTTLLRRGSFVAVQEYRGMLDSLEIEVRRNLKVAADALADLRPRFTRAARPARRNDRE
jgi:hypothetical protein